MSLVSVVLAVRNGEAFLKEALDSIVEQTYSDWEIIVVDGQSNDGTAAIAQSYSQVRYFLQSNLGIANAYNFGIKQAKGDFLAFLSCDDRWASNKLELQVRALQEKASCQYVVAHCQFYLEPNCVPPAGFRRSLLSGSHPAFIMETLLVRPSLFESIGLFDPDLFIAEDVDWFARVKDAGVQGVLLPEVLLYKRIHSNNTSIDLETNKKNLLKILRQSIQRKHEHQN